MNNPASLAELCEAYNIERHESLVVALFPEKLTELCTGRHCRFAQWISAQPILANFGGTGMARKTVMLDLYPDPVETRIKWWRVKDFARGLSHDLIPSDWEGPVARLPSMYFKPVEGVRVGLRGFNAGPWFWPWGKPEMEMKPETPDQALVEAAEAYEL